MYKRALYWQVISMLLLSVVAIRFAEFKGIPFSAQVSDVEENIYCSIHQEDGEYCLCSGGRLGVCSADNCDCSAPVQQKQTDGALNIVEFEQFCRSLDFDFYVREGCSYGHYSYNNSKPGITAICVPILCREEQYASTSLIDPMCAYELRAPSPPQAQITGYRTSLPVGYSYLTSTRPNYYNTIENNAVAALGAYCDSIGGTYEQITDRSPLGTTQQYAHIYRSTSMLYSNFGYTEGGIFYDSDNPQYSVYPFYPDADILGCRVSATYDVGGTFSPAGPNCEAGSYALARGCGPEHECDYGEGCNFDTCRCEAPYAPDSTAFDDSEPDCYLRCGNWQLDNGEQCDGGDNCNRVTCQCNEGYVPVVQDFSDLSSTVCLFDECPDDPRKHQPGQCGCGAFEVDRDGDGVMDCVDECPDNGDLTEAGACGCTEGEYEGIEECEGGTLCSNACACPTYARFESDGAGGCQCAQLDIDPYATEENPLWGEACCKQASDPAMLGGYGCPDDRVCMPYPQDTTGLAPLWRCKRTAESLACGADSEPAQENTCVTDADCKDLYVWNVDTQSYVFDPSTARQQSAAIAGLACINGVCCGASGDPNIPAQFPCSCTESSVPTSSSSEAVQDPVPSSQASSSVSEAATSATSAVSNTSVSIATAPSSIALASLSSAESFANPFAVQSSSAISQQQHVAQQTTSIASSSSAEASSLPDLYYCCDGVCTTQQTAGVCFGPIISERACSEQCSTPEQPTQLPSSSSFSSALTFSVTSSEVLVAAAPVSSSSVTQVDSSSSSVQLFVIEQQSSRQVVYSVQSPESSASSRTFVAAGPVCGNGVVEGTEECDDGNANENDSCSRYCEDIVRSSSSSTTTFSRQYSSLIAPVQYAFPSYPTQQPVSYQLPLAQLQPLVQGTAPAGDTGPAAVAVIGAGAAAGFSWTRRKNKK